MAVAMAMQAGERQLHFRLYQAVQHAALGSTANQLHRTSHYRFVSSDKRCPAKPSCETPKSEAGEHRRFIDFPAANITRWHAVR